MSLKYPKQKIEAVPSADTENLQKLDRYCIENLAFDVLQLMEIAGLRAAELSHAICKQYPENQKEILILCGKGHNGGDGLVAARHLFNWGYTPEIILISEEDSLSNASQKQLSIIKSLEIDYKVFKKTVPEKDYILGIDAILGYGSKGAPRGLYGDAIQALNEKNCKILALDNPSGLDCNTGEIYTPCIKADYTASLACLKSGFLEKNAKKTTGSLFVCDIGIPKKAFQENGLKTPSFSGNTIIQVEH